MAGLIGTLGKFDAITETGTRYEERLLLFSTANNIAEDNADRRKTVFVSEQEKDIHQVLSDSCSPERPASKTLEQLLKKWKDHFEPVPYEMAESFKFWTCVQKDNESNTAYRSANRPSMQIYQTFVTGLNRSSPKELSNMSKLTFERAVEIAVNITMVKEHARQLHSSGSATVVASSNENVNRVRFAPKQSKVP